MSEPLTVRARRLFRREESRLERIGKLAWIPTLVLALGAPVAWVDDGLLMRLVMSASIGFLLLGGVALTFVPALLAWLSVRRENGLDELRYAEDTGLTYRGLQQDAGDISLAWNPSPKVVEMITTAGDELTAALETPEEARALVEAVRENTDRRRAYPIVLEGPAVRLTRKAWGYLLPGALGTLAMWAGPAFVPVGLVSFAVGWSLARGTHRARFGADGVSLEGRFVRRYVPYREVAKVSSYQVLGGWRSLYLRLESGEVIRVGRVLNETRAELIRALIEEGAAMAEAGAAAGAHVASLERGTEDARTWRERVEGVVKESGYRGAALDASRLLSLMRNPAAAPEQRVAAALALRADPGGVAQIRVAADVSAEPGVREAFEELAAHDLDERRLGKLLRRLEG